MTATTRNDFSGLYLFMVFLYAFAYRYYESEKAPFSLGALRSYVLKYPGSVIRLYNGPMPRVGL